MNKIFNYVSRKSGDELPFIPAYEVKQRNGKDHTDLWIVIDDIVYDCSIFARRHPGGETVIKNFGGKDCTWQYHEIHGMRSNNAASQWLPKLRIGRTKEVENPYDKPRTEHVEFMRLSITGNT